ncbi:MAG: Gfo/Idh/MocA family oxidoreductase [Eubacterium sp.]|nr:Gfo/Idh/MocA family oxidoreductase [Eubacterium sp.]
MLRVGVIGTGSMGTQHFLRLMNVINNATVTAVSDINEAHAKEIIAPYDGVRYIADPIELIRDPEVDAVVIVSADPTHEEFCLEALAQKKFIFCEKPLSASAEGAKKVVDAEIAGGKRLIQLGFNRRFDPAYEELKEIVVSGKLGAPLVAHCAHRNANYPEAFDDVVAVTGTAIHEIDTMAWLVGDYFTKAQVIFPKTSKHSKNENLHDPQIVILTTSSGMVITCEIWVNCQYAYDIRCEVLCEDGTATLPRHARVEVCTANQKYNGMTSDGLGFFAEAYNREFQAWVDACNADTYCAAAASAWDGYCAAVTTDSCLKSQKSGAIEAVPLTDRPAFYQA